MAPPDDLQPLLKTEADRVEWELSTSQPEGILRAVCALANDLGGSNQSGFLLIGVEKNGTVVGVDEDGELDEQQQRLANRLRSEKLQPNPSVSVTTRKFGDRTLLLVEVAPYPVPPVVAVDGTPWVRVGTTTRRATEADLQRLNERRPERTAPFDTRPLASATLEDLQQDRLRSVWSAEREADDDGPSFPDFDAWLGQRQLARRVQGAWRPNGGAILVFGASPQDHVPGAWIDMVRYSGTDVDGPVASRRAATGTLTDQLDVAWSWISTHVENVPEAAVGIRQGFVPMYPLEALKELVRNLVQHRLYEGTHAPGRIEWFDDRIEFSNPGGPFGRAAEGEFGAHSDYRNPLVTAKLVEAGYVQQLGRGVRRARRQLEANGNPPLDVEVDGFTRVIVRRRS